MELNYLRNRVPKNVFSGFNRDYGRLGGVNGVQFYEHNLIRDSSDVLKERWLLMWSKEDGVDNRR